MNIAINTNAIRRYILENKKKCLKIAGLALVLIIALAIYLTNNLTKDNSITITEEHGNEITIGEPGNVTSEAKEELIVVDIEGAVRTPGVVYLKSGSRVNDAVLEAGGLTNNADTRGVNLAARLTDGDKVYIPIQGEQKSSFVNNSEPAGIITHLISDSSYISSDSADSAKVSGNSENAKGITADGLVNINTATSAQLQTLSGVGPVTAQRIIEFRESAGGFARIEDIMRVSGIGTKTFEGLRDKITI